MKRTFLSAFTLVELLVVISIIGILIGLSVFGLQGARESSRDARRKGDLELIRSGLEIYKSDCDKYPTTALSTSLVGSGTPLSCAVANTYIQKIPTDPLYPNSSYIYSSDGVTYRICATLEQAPSPAMDITGCGSCVTACNYKVTNP
jgi:type II secretion system protein G